jgi:hypothetical protein
MTGASGSAPSVFGGTVSSTRMKTPTFARGRSPSAAVARHLLGVWAMKNLAIRSSERTLAATFPPSRPSSRPQARRVAAHLPHPGVLELDSR